ncbi:hydroxyacylglutathione hydrolase [Salegentibacter sp. 24]|uniref:MBL fold metallo-hydrolase n=1 Tax=Salegentibacter sp. 24 TaxID=2183986 RepID=UPI0010614757|nr:MBL fold metallo-hydrolase [Salegentibacter sp. 24]TDN93401.1 hydroxyacylglutathione hydrolase [Salegentibacter sp. 24]
MFFQHVYDKTLAQASYVIGCQKTGESIVIDPKRDIDTYLEIAQKNNLKITHVAETHIHADFLAGTRELAQVTGAKMYLSDEGGPDWSYEFSHEGLKNGDKIKVGNLSLEVMHTPGHTPESITFILTDNPATKEPVMVFTGDFVFVGDIGRPDLLEKAAGLKGTQDKGAEQMYDSIKKFSELPEFIQLWPGHGAGSACGKSLGAVPSSTIGYELIRNWAFQYPKDKKGFTTYLLDGQPEPPKYFAMMKKLNRVDRPLLPEVPVHKKLSADEFKSAYEEGTKIIDARDKAEFAKAHLPGTLHIEGNNSFATWAGWLVDYNEDFIIIADESQMEDLTRKLMRIGLDNIKGFVSEIDDLGINLEESEIISLEEFKSYLGNPEVQVVDVRGVSEYQEGHIKGADNVFVGTLPDNLDKVSKEKLKLVHCQSGSRATIAASVLLRNGFKNLKVFSGGMEQWNAKNEPVVN